MAKQGDDNKRWRITRVVQNEPARHSVREGNQTSGRKGFSRRSDSWLQQLWRKLTGQQSEENPRQVTVLKETPVRYLRGHIQSVELGMEKLADGEKALQQGLETAARELFAEAIRMDRDTRVQAHLLSLGCQYQNTPSQQTLAAAIFETLATLHLPGCLERFSGPSDSLAADGERMLVSPKVAAEARFRLGVMYFNKGAESYPRALGLLEAAKPHDEQLRAERDYLLAMINLHRAGTEQDKDSFISRARKLLDSAALHGYTPALTQLESMS
ncbi:hypothetical protein ACWJJH_10660 [Endozoicomonadaceae bacterium StTr2]